ncbi:MAG: hypothetical protein D6797_02835, partial [Bdellovibrio sp.]
PSPLKLYAYHNLFEGEGSGMFSINLLHSASSGSDNVLLGRSGMPIDSTGITGFASQTAMASVFNSGFRSNIGAATSAEALINPTNYTSEGLFYLSHGYNFFESQSLIPLDPLGYFVLRKPYDYDISKKRRPLVGPWRIGASEL